MKKGTKYTCYCIRCGLTEKEIRKDKRGCQIYDKGFKRHIFKKI